MELFLSVHRSACDMHIDIKSLRFLVTIGRDIKVNLKSINKNEENQENNLMVFRESIQLYSDAKQLSG